MRTEENPNKPVQDGLKMKLLCIGCEQKFSALERKFALEIFYPANENLAHQATYGDWYCKFCVSISWRVLNHQMRDDTYNIHSQVDKCRIKIAYESWKNFLNGDLHSILDFKQHVLVFGPIAYHKIENPPKNLNSFLERNIEFDLIKGADALFTYAKIGKFVIFGFIYNPCSCEWQGGEVGVLGGEFEPMNYNYPPYILDYLINQARGMLEIDQNLSDKQKKKDYEIFLKDKGRYFKSHAYAAKVRDSFLFRDTSASNKKVNSDE